MGRGRKFVCHRAEGTRRLIVPSLAKTYVRLSIFLPENCPKIGLYGAVVTRRTCTNKCEDHKFNSCWRHFFWLRITSEGLSGLNEMMTREGTSIDSRL